MSWSSFSNVSQSVLYHCNRKSLGLGTVSRCHFVACSKQQRDVFHTVKLRLGAFFPLLFSALLSSQFWFHFCWLILLPLIKPCIQGQGVKGSVFTREAARSSEARYHVLASVYFFPLLFNWSVLWRWELFSGEADFISTCKCPGMLAERKRLRERKAYWESCLLINACHKIFSCDITNWVPPPLPRQNLCAWINVV